jgi:hypothetical protein
MVVGIGGICIIYCKVSGSDEVVLRMGVCVSEELANLRSFSVGLRKFAVCGRKLSVKGRKVAGNVGSS